MRSPCVLAFTLALALACTEHRLQPAEPAADPKPSVSAPSETQSDTPKPSEAPGDALDLFAAPSEVFAQVIRRWCASGAETFRPPGPADEEWPPRLESCADIDLVVHSQLDDEGLRAHFVTLSAPLESRELLLLQSDDHAALLETYQDQEDTSGEAPTPSRSREHIELRDLTGTATPEWIARVSVYGGDSYEADRCYANVEDHRSLIVCSASASGIACGEMSHWQTHRTTPRPEDLDECGIAAADLEEESISGFAQDVELARDRIVLTRASLAIDDPSEPSYEGEVPLATLLADPLPTIASAARPEPR